MNETNEDESVSMLAIVKWLILGALFLFGAVFSYEVGSGMAGADNPIGGVIGILVYLLIVWMSQASQQW